jgi:hypothetical protein
MSSLFKKYRSKLVSAAENRSNGCQIEHKYYLVIQDKWARKMSSVTSRLSKRKLICLLGLFVILSGSTCFYIISNAFFNRTTTSIKIIPISKPIDVLKESVSTISGPLSVTRTEFKRITCFRMYLDSLGKSPTGKKVYDSIDRCRPGFMDSLVFIENYYKSNFKN